jgi:transmembrane sensor
MSSDFTNNPMNTSSDPDWDAIGRFFAGESSAEEAAEVQRWLDENPRDRELLGRVNAVAVAQPSDVDVEAALARVHDRMLERPKLTVARGSARSWTAGERRIVIAAAAVAAAAAFVALSLPRSKPAVPAQTVAQSVYSTGVGERKSVTLADSSRVVLGPDSRLTIPAGYQTSGRSVELQGDAYFEIRHDAAKPFSVRVASAVIEDIGTRFTIESDEGDSTSVDVMEGSVRLRAMAAATGGVVLAAGDRGAIDPAGDAHVEHHVVSQDDASWTTGQLVFHDATLPRVAGELHRWYGVTLKIEDSALLARHVNMSFSGEPVDQVLKILGLTIGARVERQGDTAIVTANHGAAR